MATGSGWQQYYCPAGQGKFSSSTGTSMSFQTGIAMEYTQDLHLKMSKKIAQLTKVIYALNTKNDEHEAAISTLKEAHEEEVQQILSETREKILQYKSKISDEMDLKRRIQSLEESMELHERMKRQALAEFESYRQRVEDMQICTEAQHTQRVVSMSREVEEMRRSFEEKLRTFGSAQTQFEQEKKAALEELKGQHRQEVQELLRSHQSQNADYSKDQEKLVQLHKAEVDSLTERVEELKQDKKRLVEEYEAKLSKSQAFYERELEAMKRTQQLTADNLLAWKRTESELRREFQTQEAALQKTLGKLRLELARVTDEARENRDKSHKLQASLHNADSNVKDLTKQLDEVTQNSEIVEIRQKEAECELEAARDRVQQQATEILLKASQISNLQATQMTQEAAIRDLDNERSRLKDKVLRMDEEREALQSQSQALDDRQRQQLLSLEKTLREEKSSHEKDMKDIQARSEEETNLMKDSQARALEEVAKKHRVTLENALNNAEKEKNRMLAELDQQFEKERLSLEEQKTTLRQQLDELREELTSKLNAANDEVVRLQQEVQQGEQDMGSAEGTICTLKEAQDKLLEELDATRARLRETSNLLTALQGELEIQKRHHEAKIITTKEEEKLKMDKMALELELKWTETLRQECKKLREELREDHEEDKALALSQLAQSKEQELSSARESWQRKVEDLLEQISLLKQSLEMQLSQSQVVPQQLQQQFSQEREHLRLQLDELQTEHQRRQQRLQELHLSSMQDMGARPQEGLKDLEERLRHHHHAELQSLRDAHRQSIETLKQQSEQELQTLRFELEDEGKAMLASLRSELNHIHASAIEHLRQTHQQEAAVAKLSLEKTLENNRTQERELLGRITELQEEVSRRKSHVAQLDHQIHTLNESISTLTKELELKGKEVLKIRSEANQQIRSHEQELTKRHERELAEMSAVHSRETQNMLSDFNKAQEVLKDKISALQILLEGTEDKFRNRESRHEDLQVIAELKDMVSERESLVKKLVKSEHWIKPGSKDDKKYYQLELVNRETNFNKVFNASPNVGVINPLIKQKKKNEKAAGSRFSSSPSVRALEAAGSGSGPQPPHPPPPLPAQPGRLEPLPNSPLHHLELNSNKPLPPPTPPTEPKKFMSPPETKDSAIESPDAQRQEWFAQYFSF
ncbi:LOW QUALITY PROTEIN: protein FAM184A-like [Gymnodraco acuticeps]|uniref:LOW QUALITY PROTEIN: protein FAM184A-like n=1 Tax=Gymnodraco acuticeps TaxID=8218 RepID=A0A6P8TD13_GYMAC|nr:LOW QUALITY PROTEIN: protein FAM184A-like [Gymnodraco acuticeps]